jgi:protein-glutamine gamma-glutamyltransferase
MAEKLNSRVLVLLLIAIGLITLPHIGHISLPLSALFFTFLCWRLLGVWRPRYLPNRIVIFLLTLFGIALLYSQHGGIWGRDAGTAIFVVALGLKLLEINQKRDVYVVNYLAFIVAASQFLYEQTIAMAAYSLLVCCILLATLVAVNSVQPSNKVALCTAATIMLQALPITAIIFVVFPRMQVPAWMMFNQDKNQALSGLSETLEPGSINKLALSPQLVFRVKFTGEVPPKHQLYWRGPVFSTTDGTVWTMSHNERVRHKQDKLKFSGPAYRYNLLLEPQNQHWVYALDMPASYDASLHRNASYQLIGKNNPGEAAEYTLTSYPQYNTGDITKTEYQENRQLPRPASARIVELVKQLQGFDDKPELFIQHLLTHFRQQPFSYSLQPPLMPDNPVETFLFEARSGFCNHYATAFVYLMRVADIPARVVTGYQGGELNTVGKFLEIRQANAHAWAEVWLDGKGWVRVDPTAAIAPERIELDINIQRQIDTGLVSLMPMNSRHPFQRIEQLWTSMDYQWQRWIIRYGSENQAALLSKLGINGLLEIVFWVVAVIALIILSLAVWLLRTHPQTEDPAVQLYRRFCKKMGKAGVTMSRGEGAADFAVRAKMLKPELGDRIEEITRLFMCLRYQRSSSEQDLQLLKQRIKAFERVSISSDPG